MAEGVTRAKQTLPATKFSTNALLRSAYEGNVELMLKMLSDGIPVDVANQGGLQAIHFATKAGKVEIIDELLSHGAEVNAKSVKGNTPLHVACLLGQSEVVKLLLRHDADVNAISELHDDEFTPLYMAAQIGHQVIVTLLLAHGADPTIQTQNGCTPCDVAKQQGYKAVSELLAEYEKRINNDASSEPVEESQQNGTNGKDEDSGEPSGEGADGETVAELKAIMRDTPVRKPRPKSGPPPMCQEAIPSPKPSPLKTKTKVSP